MNDLVRKRLRGLAANPALPLEWQLGLLEHGNHDVWFGLLWRPGVADEVLEAAVSHPDPAARALIPDNWYLSAAWRARMADDTDATIRRKVAKGPTPFRMPVEPLPAETFAKLARDPDPQVRAEVAGHRDVPVEVLVALAADPDPNVRTTTCRWWGAELPRDTAESMLRDDDPRVRRAAMQRAYQFRPEFIPKLLEDDSYDSVTLFDRTKVAAKAPLDRATAEMLATHEDDELREAVAANPSLPADLVAALATDESPEVRLVVSMRRELTEQQRAAIDYTIEPHDHVTPPDWLWRNLHDLDLMRMCVHSRHVGLRRGAAQSEHLTPDLVTVLAADSDFAVRLLLCENHPDVPADLLMRTHQEASVITRWDLLERPNFPRDRLAGFAGSLDPQLRCLAVADPTTPAETIERLSHDPDENVRAGVAADPRLPVERLLELLGESATATGAASNPSLPREAMAAILTESGIG